MAYPRKYIIEKQEHFADQLDRAMYAKEAEEDREIFTDSSEALDALEREARRIDQMNGAPIKEKV